MHTVLEAGEKKENQYTIPDNTVIEFGACKGGYYSIDSFDGLGGYTCAGTDTGTDTGIDTGTDTGIDTETSTGTDTGTNTGSDTGTSTGTDTGTVTTAACGVDVTYSGVTTSMCFDNYPTDACTLVEESYQDLGASGGTTIYQSCPSSYGSCIIDMQGEIGDYSSLGANCVSY